MAWHSTNGTKTYEPMGTQGARRPRFLAWGARQDSEPPRFGSKVREPKIAISAPRPDTISTLLTAESGRHPMV